MAALRRIAGDDNRTLRNAALLGGALILVGFAVGFAGGYINDSGSPESGKPKTLEQLATATGCKPKIFNNNTLRQGTCQTGQGNFVLVTFTNDSGRRTWLKEARNAGGAPAFLVGTRWVIMGPDNEKIITMLEGFQEDLGGEVQARSQN